MASASDKNVLDNSILNLFYNTFRNLGISSNDLRREYRLLGLPHLSEYEREKIASLEGYSFTKEEEKELLISNPFGHILYKGRPIIIYIRDQMLSVEKYQKQEYNPFHICNCAAIRDARVTNRLAGRYVVTYNTSGVFSINISVFEGSGAHKKVYSNIETRDVKLQVCQDCLHQLGWRNFNKYIGDTDEWWKGGDYRKRKEIVRSFDIRQFFDECTNNIFSYEDFSDLDFASVAIQKKRTLPPEIKRWLKQSSGYRCEVCHNVFPENKLQIHHRDHNEGNNQRNNLVVICDNCHNELHLHEDTYSLANSTGSVSLHNNCYLNKNNNTKASVIKVPSGIEIGLNCTVLKTEVTIATREKASEIYAKAITNSDVDAQYILGILFLKGLYVIKNIDSAIFYLRKAAEQGHSEAQYALGTLYYDGYGLKKNDEKARYWYNKANKNRNVDAFYVFNKPNNHKRNQESNKYYSNSHDTSNYDCDYSTDEFEEMRCEEEIYFRELYY